MIEWSQKDREVFVKEFPQIDMKPYEAFALQGWEHGKLHGLPHWQRVEKNGIFLSTKWRDGKLYVHKDIDIKVVRLFAYFHDKCRTDNGYDLKHGERAAQLVLELRDTLLKDLTDDQVSLLERACRWHTTEQKTGILTIDTCFDADRLDLERVGIVPAAQKMASTRGAYYACHPKEFKRSIAELRNYLCI